MSIKNNLIRFYGNRGFLFDLTVSIICWLIFVYTLNINLNIFEEMFFSDIIGFFGVMSGFMLTAFSLLLLYNPVENKRLIELRNSNEFKNVLKYFIFTILIIITTFSFILFIGNNELVKSILEILFILIFLMIFRSLYYLFAIIDF